MSSADVVRLVLVGVGCKPVRLCHSNANAVKTEQVIHCMTQHSSRDTILKTYKDASFYKVFDLILRGRKVKGKTEAEETAMVLFLMRERALQDQSKWGPYMKVRNRILLSLVESRSMHRQAFSKTNRRFSPSGFPFL